MGTDELLMRQSGEIGRRRGFKIPRLCGCAGSSPASGTKQKRAVRMKCEVVTCRASHAEVVKLVYTLCSGRSGLTPVRVRVSPSAPFLKKKKKKKNKKKKRKRRQAKTGTKNKKNAKIKKN